MEKISDLVERLCPEGVSRKMIKDVFTRLKGTPITAGQMKEIEDSDGDVVIFAGGKTIITAFEKDIPNANIISCPSVIVQSRGIIDVQYCESPFTFKNEMWAYTYENVVCVKYLYYFLKQNIEILRKKGSEHGSMPQISLGATEVLEIPFPPLSIQQEIVRILDSFTSLITNLETELASRQKQYEYYRDQLFGEDVDVLINRTDCEIKTISELGTLTRGKRFVRTDIVEEGVPCVHYGDMYTFYGLKTEKAKTHITADKAKSMRFAKKGDVVIVGAGENDWDIGVGLVWQGEEPAAIHDACYILEHSQDPMYISHYLRSTVYHLQLRKYVSSGKISSFAAKDLAKIFIPVPSIQRQREIVSTLDTFESLITNIKQELEARKKQYEYYREQLLTFE